MTTAHNDTGHGPAADAAGDSYVVAYLSVALDERIGTWERLRAYPTESEARRFVLNLNPFSDRYAVQAEVSP